MSSPESFLARLSQLPDAEQIREVEVVYADITGTPRGKIVPLAALGEGGEVRMARAILLQTVDGGYPDCKFYGGPDPDMLLVPDASTLRRAPWSERPRAVVIADCVDLSGPARGQPTGISSRAVLRRVLAAYAELGLCPVVAPEVEFYIFAPQRDPAEPYTLPPGRTGRPEHGQSNFGMSGRNDLAAFFDQLDDACAMLGLGTDTFLHEMGPSQYEINLKHGDALELADQTFYFKHAVRETAARHGLMAVFMAKPLVDAPGSSMHVHQSLLDAAGHNVFSRPDGSESPLFHHYIAGLQQWLPELMALFAPHVNSYRRFVRDTNAPINVAWGYDNRSVGLRVPGSAPLARRVENRLAGSDGNPYLVLAASLACGLGGLKAELQPDAPAAEDVSLAGEHALCERLEDALARLDQSAFARQAFGDEFVDGFIAAKRVELKSFWVDLTPWERRNLSVQV
jgi:glutamine synthetase